MAIDTILEKNLSLEQLSQHSIGWRVFSAITIGLLLFTLWAVFVYVPNEQIMGAVQRIFYFHVAAALTSYLFIGLLFFASVFLLTTAKPLWDLIAGVSAEIAFLLCTLVLTTGMIWGHSAWNTWWRWEPRLVSFLVLWFILFSYVVYRSIAGSGSSQQRAAAIIGIFAAINVPIVIFSIKLLDHREQLHPEVVAERGLGDIKFVYALILTCCAMVVVSWWLFLLRVGQRALERKFNQIEATFT